jgi:hypothetical protein
MNMRDYSTLHLDTNQCKLKQDMDVIEHERLSNIMHMLYMSYVKLC